MRMAKGFLFVLTGFFILITAISFLMPSQAVIIHSIVINADKNDIVENIADLKRWHYWHPVFSAEGSSMTYCDNPIRYESTCCNIRYNGKAAHVEIIKSDSSSVILIFQQSGETDIENIISLHAMNDGMVQVEWKALTKLKWYPWEKFYGIFMDAITGSSYEAALQSLKNYMESP